MITITTADAVRPGTVVRSGKARWTVRRVTSYLDPRSGRQMISAVGESSGGQRFTFCKRFHDGVAIEL